MTRYILLTATDEREQVLTYSDAEMAEVYTAAERVDLMRGLAIFKAGAYHVDMREAARAATVEAVIS